MEERIMARVNEFTDLATVVEIMEVENSLKGKSFSITGHLGRPRHEIVKIIESAGGRFDKSPGWGTRYLITNQDWTKGTINGSKSNKLRKAEREGVKIITEAQFYDMLMVSDEEQP
jgi:NAD-dependent DNA ligase